MQHFGRQLLQKWLLHFAICDLFVILGRNKTISRKSNGGHPKAAFTLRNISTSSHTNKVSNNSPSRFPFPPWDLILVGDHIYL